MKCSQDTAVYKRNSKGKSLLVGVYVDDLIITWSNNEDIIEFKEQMKKRIQNEWLLGLLSYYLGIEVSQKNWGISLQQTTYAKKILEKFGLLDCNPATSPMKPRLKINKDENGEKVDPTGYRQVVGYLRYLTHTRPDLCWNCKSFHGTTNYFAFPSSKTYLWYVKGTIDYGLNYRNGREIEDFVGFSDSDYGADKVGGKSTSEMIF